jgi:chromosome segregation ATPase
VHRGLVPDSRDVRAHVDPLVERLHTRSQHAFLTLAAVPLPVLLLRQRPETVSRAEIMVGLLATHGTLIHKLGEQGFVDGPGLRMASHQLQRSFQEIQSQFREMQHESSQAEHNLSANLASLQEQVQKKIDKVRAYLLREEEEPTSSNAATSRGAHAGTNGAERTGLEAQDASFLKLKAQNLQSTLLRLEEDLLGKNQELLANRAKLAACEDELSAIQARASSLDQQLRASKDELAKTQAVCQESDLAIKELVALQQKALADMDRKQNEEISGILQRLASLDKELDDSRQLNRAAEQKLALTMHKCNEVESINAAMKPKQTRLEEELQKYQQGYLEMVQTLSKFKTVEDDFYGLQKEAVENRLALEKQLEDAEILSQQQLVDIRQEHAKSIQELTASNKSVIDACEARLIIAERKRGDAEEELKSVLEQLAKHQENSFDNLTARAESEVLIQVQKRRIKDLEVERQALLDERDSAAGRHKEETQRAESVAQEVKVSTAELNDLQQRLEAAEAGQKEAMVRGREWLMQAEAADQQVKVLTQEMDEMMIEVGFLQSAVAGQNDQYRLISEQLTRASARIQELESPAVCSSASLDPASGKLHDKEVTRRALSWLAVFDLKPSTPTALANSSKGQALEEKSPNKKTFSIISPSYG